MTRTWSTRDVRVIVEVIHIIYMIVHMIPTMFRLFTVVTVLVRYSPVIVDGSQGDNMVRTALFVRAHKVTPTLLSHA
jgi:hypothetical protein